MPIDASRKRNAQRPGDPGAGYQGTVGRTLRESTPWWPPHVAAPRGAPDIVLILLDDLGFSDFGCFGAEIRTPHITPSPHTGCASRSTRRCRCARLLVLHC